MERLLDPFFKKDRKRLGQELLQRLGTHEASDDPEFDARVTRFQKLVVFADDMERKVVEYIEATVAANNTTTSLFTELAAYNADVESMKKIAETQVFQHNTVLLPVQAVITEQCLKPLRQYMRRLEPVINTVVRHNQCLTEYNINLKKLEKRERDASKSAEKEHASLQAAASALNEVTRSFYEAFTLFEPEVESGVFMEEMGALLACHFYYHERTALKFSLLHTIMPGAPSARALLSTFGSLARKLEAATDKDSGSSLAAADFDLNLALRLGIMPPDTEDTSGVVGKWASKTPEEAATAEAIFDQLFKDRLRSRTIASGPAAVAGAVHTSAISSTRTERTGADRLSNYPQRSRATSKTHNRRRSLSADVVKDAPATTSSTLIGGVSVPLPTSVPVVSLPSTPKTTRTSIKRMFFVTPSTTPPTPSSPSVKGAPSRLDLTTLSFTTAHETMKPNSEIILASTGRDVRSRTGSTLNLVGLGPSEEDAETVTPRSSRPSSPAGTSGARGFIEDSNSGILNNQSSLTDFLPDMPITRSGLASPPLLFSPRQRKRSIFTSMTPTVGPSTTSFTTVTMVPSPKSSITSTTVSPTAALTAAVPLAPLTPDHAVTELKTVVALFDRDAEEAGELSLRSGDQIHILRMDDSGWWTGRVRDKIGVFPRNFTSGEPTAPKIARRFSKAGLEIFELHKLQVKPFPLGVKAESREQHLSDEEFFDLFGLDKNLFALLPNSKKISEKDKFFLL